MTQLLHMLVLFNIEAVGPLRMDRDDKQYTNSTSPRHTHATPAAMKCSDKILSLGQQ
jgi:hypothetical protein